MGTHIRIAFGPTYFIPINRNIYIIRLSKLAHTAWRGDGPLHFHCIWSNKISCWGNEYLVKRDWSSTLHAELIRTSLLRLEIGILSVSADEPCVCWVLVTVTLINSCSSLKVSYQQIVFPVRLLLTSLIHISLLLIVTLSCTPPINSYSLLHLSR